MTKRTMTRPWPPRREQVPIRPSPSPVTAELHEEPRAARRSAYRAAQLGVFAAARPGDPPPLELPMSGGEVRATVFFRRVALTILALVCLAILVLLASGCNREVTVVHKWPSAALVCTVAPIDGVFVVRCEAEEVEARR